MDSVRTRPSYRLFCRGGADVRLGHIGRQRAAIIEAYLLGVATGAIILFGMILFGLWIW